MAIDFSLMQQATKESEPANVLAGPPRACRRALLIASFPDSILTFREALMNALIASGLEVHVAAPGIMATPGLAEALSRKGIVAHDIPLARTGTNPLADLRLVWSLWRLMRNIRPAMTLGYTIKPVVYGSIAAWLAGVPRRFALVTGLGYAFTGERQGLMKRVITQLYRFALARVHKVFFQNPDDEALFRALAILRPGASTVVVNGSGVDVQAFSVAPLPAGNPGFLMIGRLLGDKGVREYVGAARRIKEDFPSATFRLVGWIDANPDAILQAELDAWKSEGIIEYLGRLSDVRTAIANCAVYVLPSYREGTPRTVLEAMAMGRAVVTTDAPGCRETVVDGYNGFLVPVKSVDDLEQAMRRFIDSPELVARMGACSRLVAEEKYDVQAVNAVMLREMGQV
ncbi:glycosyltransferase family 4 protein [Delftia acidovorans]|uniref:glycosyltransferase family 4 protein n=1 Tax=Delftia acidovorans TaxID=80866 RepID=UPI0022AB8DDD|nr:glycosyltransferase family 4 protein [Delftia acidovorans]WAT83482.1 glycosyltransferase family 4 protein [Delftia acidovorans]WAT84373.1 glycosyltransferase family 4 protein [Delftia acidovorans]